MRKLNKSLSFLISIVMGLSANEFNFRSFAMDNGNAISYGNIDRKNVLNKEDLKKFKIGVYRTGIKSVLVNKYGLPLNKQGNTIKDSESFVYVPESLYDKVKLYPAIDFLNNYNENKFIFVPKAGGFLAQTFPVHMIVNDKGEVLFFDSATGECGFTDNEKYLTCDSIVCLFLDNIFGELNTFDYSSKFFQNADYLFRAYVEFSNLIKKDEMSTSMDRDRREREKKIEELERESNNSRYMASCAYSISKGLTSGIIAGCLVNALQKFSNLLTSPDQTGIPETDFD